MSTTITNPTTTSAPPPGEQFLLPGMSWKFYEHLLQELGDRPIRVTYDQGALELMSPSYRHESPSRILGLLVHVLAEELEVPIKGAGSTTFRRESLQRGLEPDSCFYIAHISDILDKEELDLETDPPPDLAIEVDITHRLIDRIPIYEALGIPELWRYDGGQILVYHRQPSGVYAEPQTESLIFPTIPLSGLVEFLNRSIHTDDGTLLREFRNWAKQYAKPEGKNP